MPDEQLPTPQEGQISRRTLAKGVAWAVPAVAVATAAPAFAVSGPTTTTTTKPPCVGDIGSTGGTYPVTYDLSGCAPDGTHWDFRLTITATAQPDCVCGGSTPTHLRVTVFDNPKRTRLWIVGNTQQNNIIGGNPSTNTNPYNRLYVQKVLAIGATGTFPATGDQVRRVSGSGSDYTGFVTGSSDAVVGPIEPFGESNDALHVLMNADGTLPCNATGPMAHYRVECGSSASGPWTQLGGIGQIEICAPMIQSTVCRYDAAGNGRYRLGISVLRDCGPESSAFVITRIRRNSNSNSPTIGGSDVWTGPQTLGTGTTNISTTTAGSGSELWIEFTTDGGANHSWIRVVTTTTGCPLGLTSEEQAAEEQAETVDQPTVEPEAVETPAEPAVEATVEPTTVEQTVEASAAEVPTVEVEPTATAVPTSE